MTSLVLCPCCDGLGTLDRRHAQDIILGNAVADPVSGCWHWTGRTEKGYGIATLDNHRWSTHRLSFIAFGGTFDNGPIVRHACNVSRCTNPSHLSAGTATENMADRYASGNYSSSYRVSLAPIPEGHPPTRPLNTPTATSCHCCEGTGFVVPDAWQAIIRTNSLQTPDECWLWTGPVSPDGYGRTFHARHNWRAHRLSLHAFTGTLRTGLVARHTCHQPLCVSPGHLVAGTVQQNVEDRVARKLPIRNHGANNGGARLTGTQVTQIRKRRLAGERLSSLQDEFGVSDAAMRRLTLGVSWAKQDEDLIAALAAAEPHRPGKACRFTQADFDRMKSLRAGGATQASIAREYGVTGRMIRLYLSGSTHAA